MKIWLPVLGLLLSAAVATANAAPADFVAAPKADAGVPLVIQVDMNAQQSKLLIPKEVLGKLKADAGAAPRSLAKVQTVVAGLSLALALAFGGVWMMKHRGQTAGRALALLLGAGAAVAVSGAAFVWADVAPRPRPLPAPIAPVADGKVAVEVVEKGNEIKLIITRDQLAKLNGGVPIRPLPPGNIRPLPAPVPQPAPAPGGIGIPVPLPEPAPFQPKPLEDR